MILIRIFFNRQDSLSKQIYDNPELKEKTRQAKINDQHSQSGDSCPNQGIGKFSMFRKQIM